MKYLSKLFATALVSLLAMGGVAQAQDMKFFRIGTGGAGGTYFPIGGLIANAISSPPGARSCEKGGRNLWCAWIGRYRCFNKRICV